MSITKVAIARMQPGDKLWDGQLSGLGVRCTSGGARSWILRYRTRDRVQRLQTLGDAMAIHPTKARELARAVLVRIAEGGDPVAEARVKLAEPTVADLFDLYFQVHAPKKKTASRNSDEYLWRVHLTPSVGRRRACAIATADIQKFIDDRADTPYAANRAVRLLSKAWNVATARHWATLPPNPCRGVELHPEGRRERFLSDDEAARLDAALSASTGTLAPLFRLLLLTGARLGEWRDAQWDWIEPGALRLPDSKTGMKTIIITPEVEAVLATIPRTSRYLFPGQSGDRPTQGEKKAWRRLCAAAGISGLRIHDLRHNYASQAVSAGLSLPQIGGLLGHRSPATTARYAHLVDDAARQAAARVAATITGGATVRDDDTRATDR